MRESHSSNITLLLGHVATLRDHVRNDFISERLKVENITDICRKVRQVVWTCEETRPRIHRKKDSGDGATWEKKKMKTKAEMDGLCRPRHDSYRNDNRR